MEDLLPPSIPKPSYDLISDSSGGIYDIATDNYEPPENQQSTIEDINQEGFDELLRQEEGLGGGGFEPNATVIICINGNPYYIDIQASDPYSTGGSPNFPISEP